MKKKTRIGVWMMSLALVSGGEAWGQSLKDILNSSTVKDVISSATGITTPLNAKNLAGQWNYVSPAVQLEGDNALKNATGSLAAGELEKKLAELKPVTAMLDENQTPEMILEGILGEYGLEILAQIPLEFYCGCDKRRVERALISIGKKELQEMIDEGKPIEVNCHFCNRNYEFTVEELKELRDRGLEK